MIDKLAKLVLFLALVLMGSSGAATAFFNADTYRSLQSIADRLGIEELDYARDSVINTVIGYFFVAVAVVSLVALIWHLVSWAKEV